jgi:hypothetical protein
MDKSNRHDFFVNDRYAKLRACRTHAKVRAGGHSVIALETMLE